MKKNITTTLLGVMILLNLILWFRTRALEQNIENLQHNMSNQFSHVLSEVRGINYNVSSTLERQASIFDNISWSFGAIDTESLTIPLTVSVVPKEAHAATAATLTVNGASVQMTRDGMTFTGVISAGLFELLDAYVTFDAEGVQRSQSLGISLRPFEERLITLHAYNNGGSSFEAHSSKWTLYGQVDIDLKIPKDNAVSSLKIITTDNGTPVQELVLDPALQHQTAEYRLEIQLEAGRTYETVVLATDRYGLTYRAIVDRQVTGADSTTPDFGEMDWWDSTVILDKNGRVLYDSTSEYH